MAALAAAAVSALTTAASTAASAVGSAASAVGGALGIGGSAAAAGAPLSILPGAAAGGAGLFSGSTLASVLQGGLGLLGATAAIRQGQMQEQALKGQQQDAIQNAEMQTTLGTERRDSLKRQLLASLGQHDVATAAAGVDLSFGTPAIARSQAITDANMSLSTDAATEESRRQRYYASAANLGQMAEEAGSGGLLKGLMTAGTAGLDIIRRG